MKILILRFSSIGDIVLTTPIIRCIKTQLKETQVHFATKKQFAQLVKNNPYIDKVHELDHNINNLITDLKAENFDIVIDLHKNLRTLKIKSALQSKNYSFPKLNKEKWLVVNTKINKLPTIHIVDRYFNAVEKIGVKNDFKGIDFFIPQKDEINILKEFGSQEIVCVAIGAKFITKQIPHEKLVEILKPLQSTIVLLGGEEDYQKGEDLRNVLAGHDLYNTCGKYSLLSSASIVKKARVLVTGDTGLMHICSAFETPIVSVWGNTIPEFGMYPYRPEKENLSTIHQVDGLKCRPCSKIGFKSCPKKHFKCMEDQNSEAILKNILIHLGK